MEAWARLYGEAVQFLCVCVESMEVALAFSQMFDFKAAVNSYIPERSYMPVGFGQLGCSGFIISDSSGCFVSRKTAAYLSYGVGAFENLEKILADELNVVKPSPQEPSTVLKAEIDTIQRLELPSSLGIESMDNEHYACTVVLNDLLQDPILKNLRVALEVLESHFSDEEELMKKHGFGGDPKSSFSPLASHCKDHERILNMGRQLVDEKSSCSATTG